MRKQYLECGKIVSVHGLAGELKVQPWCDDPQELVGIKTFYLDSGARAVKSRGARVHKNMLLLRLEGINTVEEANAMRGRVICLSRNDLALGEGEYFIQDLIGLQVVDADDGRVYGMLSDVTKTGANDVYHITFPDGKVQLIPVIPQVVIETDIDAGVMRIRPLKGLFEDED